jgi:prephenate dehydratase
MSEPIRVAYQGERGAFSETAAARLLGEAHQTVPYRTFEEMFESVQRGITDCCVTPIENSLAGSIHRNYDLLMETQLTVAGETNLRVVHNLIGAGGPIDRIRRVYSHPVALAQCGRFLRAHPDIEAIPVHDTAGAVRLVMERGDAEEAAIASSRAAEIYGGTVLEPGIEDNAKNFTRFLLAVPGARPLTLAHDPAARRWKTSLILRVANTPGSLFRALGVFALQEIDLAKIESRPIEGHPWEYDFYVDVIGNAAEDPLARALDNLRSMAQVVTILGSYRTRW